MKRVLSLAAPVAVAVALLLPVSGQAKTPAGTGLTAVETTSGRLTNTSMWTIDTSADPASQDVAAGGSGTVTWTIAATKSGSGTIGAELDGSVCVTNTGGVATQGLAISDAVSRPPSSRVLSSVGVDVSAKPTLGPGASHCYPYQAPIPAASIVSGATYKDTAHVTITNQAGHLGSPAGPSPSAAAALPANATPVDSSITVDDTNGQSFTFDASGSQSYDQTVSCGSGDDGKVLTEPDTATIQSTGQTAQDSAKVHCGWHSGDLTTYGQGEWPDVPPPPSGPPLIVDYFTVYPTGEFDIGDLSKNYIAFDSGTAVDAFLYQSVIDPPGVLDATLTDPTASASGEFGVDVAALKLNTDYADAGLLAANSGLKFGDLTICGLTSDTSLNGTTVRDFLATANKVLGATSTAYTPSDLDALAVDLNSAFDNGMPSAFALQHLAKDSSCQAASWKDGDITTYTPRDSEVNWYTIGFTLLRFSVPTVYGGELDVGDTSKYYILFDTGAAVSDYLPQTGSVGVLDAVLVDPTNSAAGAFGGDVVALKLNVDFADASLLPANSGLKFGDLTICGLTADTDLNGRTVRQFLSLASTALGGSGSTDSVSDLDTIAFDLNGSFADKTVSVFAQDHLVDGSCP